LLAGTTTTFSLLSDLVVALHDKTYVSSHANDCTCFQAISKGSNLHQYKSCFEPQQASIPHSKTRLIVCYSHNYLTAPQSQQHISSSMQLSHVEAGCCCGNFHKQRPGTNKLPAAGTCKVPTPMDHKVLHIG
jgi:hypothetical protein